MVDDGNIEAFVVAGKLVLDGVMGDIDMAFRLLAFVLFCCCAPAVDAISVDVVCNGTANSGVANKIVVPS